MSLPKLQIPTMENLRRLSLSFPVILGSGSPRRKELLQRTQIPFRILTADISESIPSGEAPDQAAKRLAALKAEHVNLMDNSEQPNTSALIIGADTIVSHQGECLGKPADDSEARKMLRRLRGETHRVYTAVSMLLRLPQAEILSETEVAATSVTFANVSDSEIERYLATGDPLDKAGAYGAQELGAFLVDHLDGELDTVIGFPLLVVDNLARILLARNSHD